MLPCSNFLTTIPRRDWAAVIGLVSACKVYEPTLFLTADDADPAGLPGKNRSSPPYALSQPCDIHLSRRLTRAQEGFLTILRRRRRSCPKLKYHNRPLMVKPDVITGAELRMFRASSSTSMSITKTALFIGVEAACLVRLHINCACRFQPKIGF